MRRWVLAAILIMAFAGATTAGDDADWSIVRASGEVWIEAGGAERVSLGGATGIAPGTTLATGAAGRVLLERGEETMVVGPGTIMKIPSDSSRMFTTVIQAAGEIEFEVEKRLDRHFSVRTPHLAAVVKGTRFLVRASADGDSVDVMRGIVEVRALRSGKKVDLLPGQSARVTLEGLVVGAIRHAGLGAAAGSALASTGKIGQGGIGVSVGGSKGVGVSVGGGGGIDASIGGSDGIGVGVGGGDGIGATIGGEAGVGVGVGGGDGISVGIGGIGLGLGGP